MYRECESDGMCSVPEAVQFHVNDLVSDVKSRCGFNCSDSSICPDYMICRELQNTNHYP